MPRLGAGIYHQASVCVWTCESARECVYAKVGKVDQRFIKQVPPL